MRLCLRWPRCRQSAISARFWSVAREARLPRSIFKGHFIAFSWSLNKERIKTQVIRFLSFSQQIQRTIKKECML